MTTYLLDISIGLEAAFRNSRDLFKAYW